jgi:uncharacterized protein YaaN involved in tellurite resistance
MDQIKKTNKNTDFIKAHNKEYWNALTSDLDIGRVVTKLQKTKIIKTSKQDTRGNSKR